MSEEEDIYCRLCAELTPKIQLISPDEDVAISSKVAAKLSWINIDISPSNALPKTICFSCFDLLERTWYFLQNARTAQEKLTDIFQPKQTLNSVDSVLKNEGDPPALPGKPVDENWEAFQQLKQEIKIELVPTTDENKDCVKIEHDSDPDLLVPLGNFDSADSTDSDVPLDVAAKRKKLKIKTKKRSKDGSITSKDEKPVDPLPDSITWDELMCRCARCDAQCENIASLQVHSLQIHKRCCVYKCLDCDKVVYTFKAFIKHVRTHKEYLCYCCEFCNSLFTLPAAVRSHRTKMHNGIFQKKCRNCGAEFDTPEQLQEHNTLYNKPVKKMSEQRDPISDLKCKECNREFKSRSNLMQHRQVHKERSRNFACHVCGKMFFTKGTLSTHMLIHEGSKPFKCPFCLLSFRARGNLNSHLSLHSGVKPFVCEQCGKSFRVKRHLKSHSIVHTDLMPYICEYCNKMFRFKTRLNLHLRQHTGVKPHKCLYCQRDFTNGSNFKKHMRRRHGIDTSKKFEQ